MNIENQAFIHIHSPDCAVAVLEVGKEYDTDKMRNLSWQSRERHEMRRTILLYQVNLGAMPLNRHVSSVMIENHALDKAMLMYSASVPKECRMFIREIAFKEIRTLQTRLREGLPSMSLKSQTCGFGSTGFPVHHFPISSIQ